MNPRPHPPGLESPYLERLRWALRGLPAPDRAAIVSEIATHIAERSRDPNTSVADVLAGLGDPVLLAHAYRDDPAPDRLHLRASSPALAPVLMCRGIWGVSRFLAGFAAVLCGTCAVLLVAVAVVKPLAPGSVGLWIGPDQIAFGLLAAPGPAATEVLGLGIIPVAALAAWVAWRLGITLIRLASRWPVPLASTTTPDRKLL